MARINRQSILRRKSDFDRVFRQGRRHRGRAVSVVCLERPEGALRVAFVAGRAVGGAVARNRQRRRVREACRRLWDRIADRSYDVACVAQPRAAETGFAPLCREMETLLRRAGVLLADAEAPAQASR